MLAVPGFFGDVARDATVAVGLLLLVWGSRVTVPSLLARPLAVVASASLFIYLTHWQVYPHLEYTWPLGGLLASVVVGVSGWALAQRFGFCAVLVRKVAAVASSRVPHRPASERSPGRLPSQAGDRTPVGG